MAAATASTVAAGGELCSGADCARAHWLAGSWPDRGRVREWIADADHRSSRSGHADQDDRDGGGRRAPAMISLPAGARVRNPLHGSTGEYYWANFWGTYSGSTRTRKCWL
jgi:hypothetical protein